MVTDNRTGEKELLKAFNNIWKIKFAKNCVTLFII